MSSNAGGLYGGGGGAAASGGGGLIVITYTPVNVASVVGAIGAVQSAITATSTTAAAVSSSTGAVSASGSAAATTGASLTGAVGALASSGAMTASNAAALTGAVGAVECAGAVGGVNLAVAVGVIGALVCVGALTITLPPLVSDGRYYVALRLRPFYSAANYRSWYVSCNPNITRVFDTADPSELHVLTLDASAGLAAGETLTAVTKTAITVEYGVDPSVSLVLGTPQINGVQVTIPQASGNPITIAAGNCVQVEASAGLTGCRYLISITCTTSNPDKILTLKGVLPVSAT